MITRGDYNSIPFDIKCFRIIQYKDSIEGKAKYEDKLRKTLEAILRDKMCIYKSEFNLLLDIYRSMDDEDSLYSFMAISKLNKPISLGREIHLSAHNELRDLPDGSIISCKSDSRIDEDTFSILINLKYADIVGDLIVITEKGMAFIEFLKMKGFRVDSV
jgi:hypothetical protein